MSEHLSPTPQDNFVIVDSDHARISFQPMDRLIDPELAHRVGFPPHYAMAYRQATPDHGYTVHIGILPPEMQPDNKPDERQLAVIIERKRIPLPDSNGQNNWYVIEFSKSDVQVPNQKPPVTALIDHILGKITPGQPHFTGEMAIKYVQEEIKKRIAE